MTEGGFWVPGLKSVTSTWHRALPSHGVCITNETDTRHGMRISVLRMCTHRDGKITQERPHGLRCQEYQNPFYNDSKQSLAIMVSRSFLTGLLHQLKNDRPCFRTPGLPGSTPKKLFLDRNIHQILKVWSKNSQISFLSNGDEGFAFRPSVVHGREKISSDPRAPCAP